MKAPESFKERIRRTSVTLDKLLSQRGQYEEHLQNNV